MIRLAATLGGILLVTGAVLSAEAQAPIQYAERGPMFFAVVDGGGRVDARDNAVLRSRIAVNLRAVSISAALDTISRRSGLAITYDPRAFDTDAQVSLAATDISVSGALTVVLLDAGLDVEMTSATRALLVPRSGLSRLAATHKVQPGTGTGIVAGVVTDAQTGERLQGVVVRVVGTSLVTRTALDGVYSIKLIPVGAQVMTFARLGYIARRRQVDVTGDSTVHADVGLVKSAVVLDQVVTTVTGDQQLRSMGNTIGTINADSLVPTTPVANFGDVLNGRVAGVQVFEPGGLTGASPQITIRGVGALETSTQPLVYIDGVRVSNTFVNQAPAGASGEAGGRLDDLIPEDIASIEVVKGPSAATLYGTDAANGVILVTTKRGSTGAPRWNAYAEGGALTIDPDQYPENLAGWGHTPSGTVTSNCTLLAIGAKQCAQDSVTAFSPLRTPSLTPLGTGNRAELGLQTSGGSPAVRYFASGNYTSEVGYLKLPRGDVGALDSILGAGGVGGQQLHPNAIEKFGGRVNLVSSLGSAGDVTVGAGLVSNDSRLPTAGVLGLAFGGLGYRDPTDGWDSGVRPYLTFGQTNDERADHFTGNTSAHWSPTRWFNSHATVGLDYTSTSFNFLQPTGLVFYSPQGVTTRTTDNVAMYSVDLGAAASVPLADHFRSTTSAGVQYNRATDVSASVGAGNLFPGATNVGEGTPSTLLANDASTVVAGVYGEERVGVNDRLFVTGALRVDGANDFGANFRSAVYPKIAASWLLSEEPFFPRISPLSTLRLRFAYGESGTQPGLSLTNLRTLQSYVDGGAVPAAVLNSYGNPNLQPERQKELEAGLDADWWKQRVHAEFTYYSKKNTNALYPVPLGSSLGGGVLEENIGEIWNWGYEAELAVEVVQAHAVSWSVTASGSVNHNQILSLGRFFQATYGQFGAPSFVQGYPAYSYFDLPITGYHDQNGDGIIEPNEVTVGTARTFISPVFPPIQATLATHIGLLGDRVTIGAQFDYRGGFEEQDNLTATQCELATCRGAIDPHAPLAEQAASVALNQYGTFAGYYSDAEFVRFRELSLSYAVSPALASWIRARSLTITLSARNLALWTRWKGGDPETNGLAGQTAYGPYFPGGLPSAQYWLVRLNVGF